MKIVGMKKIIYNSVTLFGLPWLILLAVFSTPIGSMASACRLPTASMDQNGARLDLCFRRSAVNLLSASAS